jgi:hypothetical protein
MENLFVFNQRRVESKLECLLWKGFDLVPLYYGYDKIVVEIMLIIMSNMQYHDLLMNYRYQLWRIRPATICTHSISWSRLRHDKLSWSDPGGIFAKVGNVV